MRPDGRPARPAVPTGPYQPTCRARGSTAGPVVDRGQRHRGVMTEDRLVAPVVALGHSHHLRHRGVRESGVRSGQIRCSAPRPTGTGFHRRRWALAESSRRRAPRAPRRRTAAGRSARPPVRRGRGAPPRQPARRRCAARTAPAAPYRTRRSPRPSGRRTPGSRGGGRWRVGRAYPGVSKATTRAYGAARPARRAEPPRTEATRGRRDPRARVTGGRAVQLTPRRVDVGPASRGLAAPVPVSVTIMLHRQHRLQDLAVIARRGDPLESDRNAPAGPGPAGCGWERRGLAPML